jgi:hypothetical protein
VKGKGKREKGRGKREKGKGKGEREEQQASDERKLKAEGGGWIYQEFCVCAILRA